MSNTTRSGWRPRPSASHTRHESAVEFAGLALEHSNGHGDASGFELAQACSRDARVRVLHRDDDPRGRCFEHGIDARRRPALMGAGLERYVHRAAASATGGRCERMHLRVRLAGPPMPALADDRAGRIEHHASHARIRRRRIFSAASEAQGVRHVHEIDGRRSRADGHFLSAGRSASFAAHNPSWTSSTERGLR